MKNILSKSYMTIFFLFVTFATFATEAPGDDDTAGNLNGNDAPAPIGDYVWVLALLGIALVFLTFRAIQNKKIRS